VFTVVYIIVAKEGVVKWFSPVMRAEAPEATPGTVHLPAPTAMAHHPCVRITLIFAGLLTSASVSILGAILFVTSCVGWFRDVLTTREGRDGSSPRRSACHFYSPARSRKAADSARNFPTFASTRTYPVSAGIKGGLAGSVAMAVLACLYGL